MQRQERHLRNVFGRPNRYILANWLRSPGVLGYVGDVIQILDWYVGFYDEPEEGQEGWDREVIMLAKEAVIRLENTESGPVVYCHNALSMLKCPYGEAREERGCEEACQLVEDFATWYGHNLGKRIYRRVDLLRSITCLSCVSPKLLGYQGISL